MDAKEIACPTPPGAALDFLMLMQQLKVRCDARCSERR